MQEKKQFDTGRRGLINQSDGPSTQIVRISRNELVRCHKPTTAETRADLKLKHNLHDMRCILNRMNEACTTASADLVKQRPWTNYLRTT